MTHPGPTKSSISSQHRRSQPQCLRGSIDRCTRLRHGPSECAAGKTRERILLFVVWSVYKFVVWSVYMFVVWSVYMFVAWSVYVYLGGNVNKNFDVMYLPFSPPCRHPRPTGPRSHQSTPPGHHYPTHPYTAAAVMGGCTSDRGQRQGGEGEERGEAMKIHCTLLEMEIKLGSRS